MADREYVVTFEGDRARIRLVPSDQRSSVIMTTDAYVRTGGGETEYHVFTADARRAEQIARVMKGQK